MKKPKLLSTSIKYSSAMILAVSMSFAGPAPWVLAATDYQAQMEERKSLEIQSNNTAGWPSGPELGCESAILLEADTGTILYAKNIDEELYPASTTKMLTCLLAAENGDMTDEVTFSYDAVHSVPADGSSIGMDAGEYMPLEQCLYGIMVGSANECANAVAEYVSGDLDSFADLMNTRARELGCTHSHFINANGLFDENHYTSAHDLAMIARAFFANELLSSVGNTARYHFTPSAGQPDDFYITNKHKLINGEITYTGIKGGKTGYTGEARETLVTCAEQGDMKLICVVLKEESPYQFTDTTTLFDYGFNNFHSVNISENDKAYLPDETEFFSSSSDVFGNSGNVLEWNDDDRLILPVTASIEDCESSVTYNGPDDTGVMATVSYSFNGVPVGSGRIMVAGEYQTDNGFESSPAVSRQRTVYVNIRLIIWAVAVISGTLIFIMNLSALISSLHFASNDPKERRRFKRRQKMLKEHKLTYKRK